MGRPLRSARLGETLLPKRIALAVFCSDPISSVAYATEQIVLVLAAGGLVALPAGHAVGRAGGGAAAGDGGRVLPADRFAYPSGGGAYVVSRDNLGESAVAGRRRGVAGGLRDDRGGVRHRPGWSR